MKNCRQLVDRRHSVLLLVLVVFACSGNGDTQSAPGRPGPALRDADLTRVRSLVDEEKLPPTIRHFADADDQLLWNVARGIMSEFGYRQSDKENGLITSQLFGWTDPRTQETRYASVALRLRRVDERPGSTRVGIWCYRFERRDAANRPVADDAPGAEWVMTGLHLEKQEEIAQSLEQQYTEMSRGELR